jgi:hypothetical protein
MLLYTPIQVSDSTVATPDNPFVAGLTITIVELKTTGASPVDVSSHATITALGGGIYQIAYDAELYGEAAGVLDASSALTTPTDRFFAVAFFKDSSRIQTAIAANGQLGSVGSVANLTGIPISQGTVASGTMSTTSFVATGATLSTIAGAYLSNPSRVVWTSGVLRCSGSYAVTAYSGGSSPTITVATMPAAPSFDDTFDIVG